MLRRQVQKRSGIDTVTLEPHTIVVSGGKGGVGKSNVSLNLAWSLAESGQRVLLMDTDFGLTNLDVLLGVSGEWDMADVLASRCTLEQALVPVRDNLDLLLGGLFGEQDNLRREQVRTLLGVLSRQMAKVDYVVIDTRAGLSDTVIGFLLAADTVVMVSTIEPTSVLDTYRTVKRFGVFRGRAHLGIVVNRCSQRDGERAYASLSRMIRRFLHRDTVLLGTIPDDRRVGRAVLRQVPFVDMYPHSPAGRAIRRLSERIDHDASTADAQPRGFLARLAGYLVGSPSTPGDDA